MEKTSDFVQLSSHYMMNKALLFVINLSFMSPERRALREAWPML
jgi:hypothetical protein